MRSALVPMKPMMDTPWLCLLGLATTLLVAGCRDDCDAAIDLCKECEIDPGRCEATFRDGPTEFCAEAVKSYEASCSR